MKQIFYNQGERHLARRLPDSFNPDATRHTDADGSDDMLLDSLISRSVSQLDRSPGLPSNFAYRTAMRAAAEAAESRARTERRELLLSRLIPAAAVVAAIAAVAIAVPNLPRIVADIFTHDSQYMDMAARTALPASAAWLIGVISVVGAMLLGLNTILKRIVTRTATRNQSTH